MDLDEHWTVSGQRLVVTGRPGVILEVSQALEIPASQIVIVNASRSSLALTGSYLESYLQWRHGSQDRQRYGDNEDQINDHYTNRFKVRI